MLRLWVYAAMGSLLLLPCLAGQRVTKESRRSSQAEAGIAGEVVNGIYKSPAFGFSYKIPFGWVDRTEAMRQSDSGDAAPQPSKSQVLLAVFERPPEAPRSTVNSGVVVAAESVSSYPGLKEAVDYFGPLEQVTVSKGFKVVNEPYEFTVGERPVAREDFSKEAGDMTMHQTCLVLLRKGYLVSLTFVSDNDDAMNELLEGLSFPASQSSSSPHPAPSKK
jgi:hypothetical protein